MQENEKIYPFESSDYVSNVQKNVAVFNYKFGIKNLESESYEHSIISSFCKTNILNIIWYRDKLEKENNWRLLYSAGSVILIIFVPLFIYFQTSGWSQEGDAENRLTFAQNMASSITVILTLILALHKLISSWIEKRKFSALFHKASVDLKNILYKLEADHAIRPGNYTTLNEIETKVMEAEKEEGSVSILSNGFLQDIETAIKESRKVVDEETNTYFKTRGNPSFDLAILLTTSSQNASTLFGLLKNKNVDIEALKEEVKEEKKEQKEKESKIAEKSLNLELKMKQLERLTVKEVKLANRLVPLEELESLTDVQKNTVKDLNNQYDILQKEIEKIEFEILSLNTELTYLR